MLQSILISCVVASQCSATGAVFQIWWPCEDLQTAVVQQYLYCLIQHMEPSEMHLNPCCSVSAETSLIKELYSVLVFLVTLSVAVIM